MTEEIPTVDYALLNVEDYVTSFIQPKNPVLTRLAKTISGADQKEVAEQVLKVVASGFSYPINVYGQPSTARQVRVFERIAHIWYHADVAMDYGWLYPAQTCAIKKGICIDTACVATTLLRIKDIEAYVALGAVLDTKSGRVLGFHAWSTAQIAGVKYLLETTVHPQSPGLVKCSDYYYPESKAGISYDELAYFDEKTYKEDAEKIKKYEEYLNAE